MRRLIALLNTMPAVKQAIIMGGMMFVAGTAGAVVGRMLALRAAPRVTLHCVCEP